MKNYNVTVIPGDGIGPEIVAEAMKVLDAAGEKYGYSLDYTKILMGGCSIDEYGVPLTDEAIAIAKAGDAVLLGAVGGNVGNSRWYDVTPDYIKYILGLDNAAIDWRDELSYRNGYPRQMSFSNIAIRYGAENAENWTSDNSKTADQKVRLNMGIQLDMSGNGCRAFETYSDYGESPDAWLILLERLCALQNVHITRLDLAYDDRTGILPMNRLMQDVEDQFWTGSPSKWRTVRSGDQRNNLKGNTAYIGSPASQVYLRIYDKAAEREYSVSDQVHWIRVELVLRHDRANSAVQEILNRNDIGVVMCGVLKNYCCFREESNDSNKSRWPIADYWAELLQGVERIRLFSAPGEAYNFKRTEEFLIAQWGQVLLAYRQIYGGIASLMSDCSKAHPQLKPKYQKAIEEMKLQAKLEKEMRNKFRQQYLLSHDPNFPILNDQLDIADIFPVKELPKNDNPGTADPRYKIPK